MSYKSILERSNLLILMLLLIPFVSAITIWEEGFESGFINGNLSTVTGGAYPVTRVRGEYDCGDGDNYCGRPYAGRTQLEMACSMDSNCDGWASNSLYWNGEDITLYDKDNLWIYYYYKDHGDESHRCRSSIRALGDAYCDGFWIKCSNDEGVEVTDWYLLENLDTAISGEWIYKNYNISYYAPNLCGENYKPYAWAITQYDNYAIRDDRSHDGFTVDDMALTSAEVIIPEDFLLDGCQDITESGDYNLTQNIITDVTPCWDVSVDNVSVDGKGYEVVGDDSLIKPEAFNLGSGISNFTVYNLSLEAGGGGTQPIYRFIYGTSIGDVSVYEISFDSIGLFIYLSSVGDLDVYSNNGSFNSHALTVITGTGWVNLYDNSFYCVNRYDYPFYLSSTPKYNISNNYFYEGKPYITATGVNNHNSTIFNNTFEDTEGIHLSAVHYSNVYNNSFIGGSGYYNYSIYAYTSGTYNEFFNNLFIANTIFKFIGSTNTNYIYNNNWSSGSINAVAGQTNYWNTTLNCTGERNIINGSCMGGNYYHFNSNCTDSDRNGICDDYYNHSTGNIDYLPLVVVSAVTEDYGAITFFILMMIVTSYLMIMSERWKKKSK